MPQPTTTPPTEALAARLVAGDESALRDLLAQFGGTVFAALSNRYSHVFGNADLEDVLAIAIHRLWKARQSIDPTRASILPWFRRIAENSAADILRHGWQKARLLELPHLHDAYPEPPKPAHSPIPSPRTSALREIVAELPDIQRKIIWADALTPEGGPANSTFLGADLGVPSATVRVYRKRALAKIRTELTKRHLAP